MGPQKSITTPIALSCTKSATITLPWFVQQTEYNPAQATFKPLVNGEEAFGTIYDAMLSAKSSVDIICGGFQPSMHFKRGSGSASVPIGQLLAQLGASGIKVRLLCWQDDLHLAELSENEAPGNNLSTSIKPLLPDWFVSLPKVSDFISKDYQAGWEREFDIEWYRRANLNNVARDRVRTANDQVVDFASRKDAFRNVECQRMHTRPGETLFCRILEIRKVDWPLLPHSSGFRTPLPSAVPTIES